MTTKQPNAKETALLTKMQKALDKHMQYDTREGGTYFASGTETIFQGLARELADLIQEQGPQKTYSTFISLAKKLQGLSAIEWDHANSIGFAFEKGLGAEAKSQAKANPFAKKNFPKL